jgi:hypothetical protein
MATIREMTMKRKRQQNIDLEHSRLQANNVGIHNKHTAIERHLQCE